MKWQKLMESNVSQRKRGLEPVGFLMAFQDDRTSSVRLAWRAFRLCEFR